MKPWAMIAALLVAGCATNISAVSRPATKTWLSSNALDPSVACVVQEMRTGFKRTDWSFAAGIIVPNSVFEIRPQAVIMVGGDPLVVRLTKQEANTKIELFGLGVFGKEAIGYVEKCV